MSYNGSGTFQINTSGQPVVAGPVISSTAFNALTADLATGLSTAITKDGQTTATARIPFAQGISSTLTTDSSSVSTGSIITAGGVGIAKALYVGTNANVAGTLAVTGVATFSAAPIYSSLTASSAVATDASKALVSVTNTGTGNNVLATSPTLVTPALGTPSSGLLTNCTGLPQTGLAANVAGNGPAFSAYQTGSAQVFTANTFNKVVLNAEEFDTNSNFDSTTNYRFTPTVAGYYQINGCINMAGGANLAIAIYKNGSVFKYGSGSTTSGITSSNVAAIISMDGSTDYVELYGFSNLTSTLVANLSSTYFQASLARSA